MKKSSFLIAPLCALVFVLAMPGAVYGAPPSNDNFTSATVVTSLPFSDIVAINEATTESGEPLSWFGQSRTVWYSFTPSSHLMVRADLGGSDYVTAFVSVYRADSTGFGGLTKIASGRYGPGFTFQVQAGTTYYLQGGDDNQYGWVSTLGLNLNVVDPPLNDNFADAIAFTSVPFSDSRDLTAATTEPGEPMACGATFNRSAWYAFTPTTSGAYGAFGVSAVNVYTGTSLGALTSVACSEWPGLYFHADAATTYYLQDYGGGLTIDVIPPPDPGWGYSPGDPSKFDDISFSHGFGYWDPTITLYAWDFGDGTTATGNPTSHRFTADGDYSVTLTVTARGGRTNSQTQVIHVRTPDTPPEITVPADITVNATSTAGANVTFTATATDVNPANPAVTCIPSSGSVFKIGDTQVVCSATDAAGQTATKSFNVHVKGAPEQVADLIVLVDSYYLGQLGTALHEKLTKVQGFLAANKPRRACEVLDRFLAQVKEQRGKRISVEQADRLTIDAWRIKAVISC